MYTEDTIAAIATAPGPGGIGVIRVSGPAAQEIADHIFRRSAHGAWRSHRLYHGHVISTEGAPLDEGLSVVMRAPHSYTGEDVLELHCHGSPVVLRLALQTALRLGARPAERGEFTKRAFLNGKLDLSQAEAVIDLVRARTPAAAGQAFKQLSGTLALHLKSLRERLIAVRAHLEAQLDFADEEIDLEAAAPLRATRAVLEQLTVLLGAYKHGRLLREGLHAAVAGAPNVGKSSLFNALLGEDRAIVTAEAGTTRDVIEESADFRGVPVTLSDTAGIREVTHGVESLGVERAHRVAESADVVLMVHDISRPPVELLAFPEKHRIITVLNKTDLPCAWTEADVEHAANGTPCVRVSALQRSGLDALREAVISDCSRTRSDSLPVITTARQCDALAKARESLERTLRGLLAGTPPDLVAVDLQVAMDHIGSVTGAISNEEVLDRIFAEFCIGK